MQGGTPPTFTLLDLIIGQGAMGCCNLSLVPIGFVASLITFFVAKRRRTAILVPACFAGAGALTGITLNVWSYSNLQAGLADTVNPMQPWEIQIFEQAIRVGIGQAVVVTVLLLAMVAVPVFLKRDRVPADPDAAGRARGRRSRRRLGDA